MLVTLVCIGLSLSNVIIMHMTPQLAAYPRQEYFKALVEEVINVVVMESVKDAYKEEEVEDL